MADPICRHQRRNCWLSIRHRSLFSPERTHALNSWAIPVKVRLQDAATASKYKSTINATAIIVREEGVRGLFKGITSPLV